MGFKKRVQVSEKREDCTVVKRKTVHHQGGRWRSPYQATVRKLKRQARAEGTPLKDFMADHGGGIATRWLEHKGLLYC